MARICSFATFFLLYWVAVLLMTGLRTLQAASQSRSFAGVFMVIEDGKYTLDFAAAQAACLDLNVTMATTAQMERALQRGLETCKFGWTAEQIAVIPRQTSDPKCGVGKTGVVTWSARPDKEFAVFCFNTSAVKDLNDVLTTTVGPLSSLSSTGTGTNPATPMLITTTSSSNRKSTTTNSPKQKLPNSTFTPLRRTTGVPVTGTPGVPVTGTTGVPVTGTPGVPVTGTPSHANIPTSHSHDATSEKQAFTSVHALVSTEAPAQPPLGVLQTTFIILGVMALLVIAAATIWQHKVMFFPCWSKEQLKDDVETEMWKNIYSENDLQSQPGTEEEEEEEEEEVCRKYSSDITLRVNPSINVH